MAEDVNINVKVNTQNAQKNTESFRTKVRELTAAMTQLQLEGKANTAEYQKLAAELGRIRDAMGDTAAQARILSDDFFQQRAAMEGLAVGVNIFSGLAQAAALCGVENENLQEVLVKLQAAQNLANVAMNVAKALNKDTALMTALRMRSTQAANTELTKETANLGASTAAMGTYTAGEVAATGAAGFLRKAIHSVGTAMKSVPVIGWVLAATAAIGTLIALIGDANEAEEEGNRLRAREQAQLDAIHAKHQKITEEIRQQNYRLSIQLGQIKALSTGAVEYQDVMAKLASTTNLSVEYLQTLTTEQQQAILDTYTSMSDAQEYLAELNDKQAEYNKKWEEAKKKQYSDDEDERKRAIADLEWMSNAQSSYYKETQALSQSIASAQARVEEQQKRINVERQKELDWKRKTTAAAQAQKDAEKEANKAIQERNALIKSSIQDQEALLKFINEQEQHFNEQTTTGKLKNIDREEEAILNEYDVALDAAIKYYGADSEYAQKLQKLRLQALDELADKRRQIGREEVREAADRELNIAEARLNTELEYLPQASKEYYDKKIQIDKQEEERELIELARLRQDNEISLEEYQANYDLIVAQHARNRKDIELEYTKQTLEEQQDMRDAQIEHTMNSFTAMSNYITALQDAELENVKGNEQEEANVRKRYARLNFASQVASIGIDIAKGIMSVWSTAGQAGPILGPILGGIQTAFISATGLAQIAKAKAAMEEALSGKAARGGYIVGNSHANGGVKIEAEGGEAILNKRAMSIPAFRQLASDMNAATGGVSFANSSTSSALTASIDPKIIKTIVDEVAAIPVVVSEQMITHTQRQVNVIQNRKLI